MPLEELLDALRSVLITRTGDRLVVNPGAAGPRRFDLEPSVARLTIAGGLPAVEIVPLRG